MPKSYAIFISSAQIFAIQKALNSGSSTPAVYLRSIAIPTSSAVTLCVMDLSARKGFVIRAARLPVQHTAPEQSRRLEPPPAALDPWQAIQGSTCGEIKALLE